MVSLIGLPMLSGVVGFLVAAVVLHSASSADIATVGFTGQILAFALMLPATIGLYALVFGTLLEQRRTLAQKIGVKPENQCANCVCYLCCLSCMLTNEKRTIKRLQKEGRIGAPVKASTDLVLIG